MRTATPTWTWRSSSRAATPPRSRNCSTRARTSSCRPPRNRSGPRGRGSRPSSRCPGGTSSTCRRPATSASRAASVTNGSATGSALRALSLPSGGFIVRTNAEGKSEGEFAADVEFLTRLWAQIQGRFEQATAPAILHEEGDLTFRVVRDLFSPEIDEFVVDSREVYDKCAGYVEALVPALRDRVRRWAEPTPIFEALGIEKDIEKALRRRVWLKSGGYIVIDHTEALVSIDVNTGKYVGKRDFEQTVLKINLEAVGEVVRQIRLRDLGGIIIIDFIDMEREEHREQVFKALKRALAEDKARTNVLQISELGLVEMTRKRVRQDLRSILSVQCPTCRGRSE